MQLEPVFSQEIYKQPKSIQNAALWDSEDNLWNNHEVVVLTTNFRQGVSEWTNTLNRIRIGEVTQHDIDLLESRRMSKFPTKDFSRACHLFRSNREVAEHNNKVLNSLNTAPMFSKAEIDAPKGVHPKVNEITGRIEKTGKTLKCFQKTFFQLYFSQLLIGWMDCLLLKIGVRAMIIANIDIPDGLVNGSIGTVVGYVYFCKYCRVSKVKELAT